MNQLSNTVVVKDKPRIKTLDSLRGLAAVTVMIAHCFNNLDNTDFLDKSPLYIIKAAHEAVIFFFLLSGYVLAYQYESNKKFRYGEFLILRVCRIYLPYIASIVFCLAIYIFLLPTYSDASVLGSFWQAHITTPVIVDHAILIGNFNTDFFNPAMWSLVHEMRVAIIFPLLLLIIRFRPSVAISMAILVFWGSALLIVLNVDPPKGFLNSYCYTLYYFPVFILGGLIVKHQSALIHWYAQLKFWQKVAFIVVALAAYTYAHTISFVLRNTHFPLLLDYTFAFKDLLTTLAAFCVVIVAIFEAGKGSFLDSKVPLFLGKISYSLYLVHLPILIFVYKELHGECSIWVIFLIGVSASILVATLFNYLIERNATRLGKRLTSKYREPRQPVTAVS